MKQNGIRLVFGIFMTAFYLIMAILIVVYDFFEMKLAFRIIIGVLFFAYGIFRGFRVWKAPMINER